jgi:hypothetical protein
MTLQIQPHRRIARTPQPLGLVDKISGSVIQEWGEQTMKYTHWWDWYDGLILDARSPKKNDKKMYPLAINTIRQIVGKHAIGLWGDIPEGAQSLVEFECRNADGETDEVCLKAAAIINRIWRESNGSDLQIDNAVTSQVLGGCIYRIAWQPWNTTLSTGFRINKVIPDYFLPVWSDDDPWTHPEVWVMQYISGDEGRLRYGVETHNMPYVLYLEHWTNDVFEIEVNNEVPKGDGFGPDNPFGIVPFVYIPHFTRAGGHYGMSHVPDVSGMIEELNSRMVDRADGVKHANSNRIWGRNLPANGVVPQKIGDTEILINIGSTPMGTNAEPEVFTLDPSSVKGAQVSREFINDVKEFIQDASDTPSIMFGPSAEGSQPSGDARDLEFWPYTQHQKAERAMTHIGFGKIGKMLLAMLFKKAKGGVTKEMLDLEVVTRWGASMPQRRDLKVQEVVQRRTTQPPTMSLVTAVRVLSEGENVEEEVKRIQAEIAQAKADEQTRAERDQKMALETQRQNMQMKLQSMAMKRNAGAKSASSRQKDGR